MNKKAVKTDQEQPPIKARNLSTLIGNREKFHPEITTRYKFTQLFGKNLIMLDARILENYHGKFGTHDAALMAFRYQGAGKNGENIDVTFTSIDSGIAVVDMVKKVIANKYFPVAVIPANIDKDGGGGSYHGFVITDDAAPEETPPEDDTGEIETDLPF